MSENGNRNAAALRAQLARVERMREEIAKAWLVDVILASPLAAVERMPLTWATSELPELISDVLAATAEADASHPSPRASSGPPGLPSCARLGAGQLTREISSLQSALLATLSEELPSAEPQLFAQAAQRLAADLRAGHGHRGRRRCLPQGEPGRDPVHRPPAARPDAAPARPADRDPPPLRPPVRARPASTSRARGSRRGRGARDGVGCWRSSPRRCARASAWSTRPSGSRTTSSASSLPIRPPRTACRWPSGCRALAELEARGGIADHDLGRRRRLPRARRRRRARCCAQADTAMWRARATGQPVGVRRPCKIANSFRKTCR